MTIKYNKHMTNNNIYWLNKDSRQFLQRGYLLPGETPED